MELKDKKWEKEHTDYFSLQALVCLASHALRIEFHLMDRGNPLESYALSSTEAPERKSGNGKKNGNIWRKRTVWNLTNVMKSKISERFCLNQCLATLFPAPPVYCEILALV